MKYKLNKANTNNINSLIEYKLNIILEYAPNLINTEINEIKNYVIDEVSNKLDNYKIINMENKEIGCLLIENKDDGILLDEIYIEEEYRNKGIGTDIVKNILLNNNIVYLWVYKLNTKAIDLYKRMGFVIIDETESRYYMKYEFINKI